MQTVRDDNPTATQPFVTFFVTGTPRPQGSKRAFVIPKTKKVVVTESAGVHLKDWRHDVALMARSAMGRRALIPRTVAVSLVIEFVLPRPVATPRSKPTPAAVKRPDLDKISRAVGDSLTNTVYTDDSQVVASLTVKRIAEVGEPAGAGISVYTEEDL